MKYLGIDYGLKRVGISVSDEEGKMAFPRVVLQNDKKLIENLEKIIKEEKIQKVILGESKNFKLEDNDVMREVLDLKLIIESELNIDVIFHNEMFSSAMAEQIQGKNKMIDASAACIILQSYLDLKNK